MNPTWPAVDNALDLIGNIWIGLVVIMAAAVPSWMAARNHKSISAIKDQVVNGHAPEQNLRDDVDRINAHLEALTHDIRSLRTDLMAEEDRRRIQIQDVRQELDHRIGKRRNL